jgi:hypothetical protein
MIYDMKTLKKLLFLLVGIGLLAACEKNDWGDETPGKNLKKSAKHSALVTVPIKANFSVVLESGVPDDTYLEYPYKLTMVGEGTMSHLGKMTTRMVFWAEGGAVGPYGYGTGSFVAANGDELHFEFDEGLIIMNEKDNSDFYLTRFNVEFLITGGTGRFEGASGIIMSNAFVHFPADENDYWHTDFFSYGTLVKKKGKK